MADTSSDKIRTVLIGTDLDRDSDALLSTGVQVARAAGAKVHVAYAFAPPIGYVSELGAGVDDAVLAQEMELTREAVSAQVRQAGISAEELAGETLRTGVPHRVLPELAQETGAGLVIVGATGGGRLHRRLGSTADRVLRRTTRPVLVVRGALPVPPRRVLAPVDLSPLSAEAFRHGLAILSQLGGGTEIEALFVLSVIQRQVAPQFTPQQVDRFAVEELDRFVEKHAGSAAGQVRRKVRPGNTREEIFAEIADFQPDVVLLGTHGLGGFDRLVIGSVAADVAREAPCSVLVVPPVAMREA
ncbi:MAG TPA: universal stress protein [Thermoanaerobaculia bacterium]|nr:universal stress protein [Thermoanaerobaculia bacterium]